MRFRFRACQRYLPLQFRPRLESLVTSFAIPTRGLFDCALECQIYDYLARLRRRYRSGILVSTRRFAESANQTLLVTINWEPCCAPFLSKPYCYTMKPKTFVGPISSSRYLSDIFRRSRRGHSHGESYSPRPLTI